MRVALVHHWFTSVSGGERVVDALCRLFPDADIYTLFCGPGGLPANARKHKVTASILNRIPGGRRFHRHLLPLYPLAVESLDLTGYDLVVSSDSGPVKGIITDPKSIHVCYCHSPMRYLWDAHFSYSGTMSALPRWAFRLSSHYVRNWDYAAAQRVDYFVANSDYVASRIRKYYRRDSTVIPPPVETHHGFLSASPGDYYLSVGRLVPYKRTDLLISACKELDRKLVIVGTGPELRTLRRKAGPNIDFLGAVDDSQLWQIYSRCKALLFAADEDFGIVPVEAQACGRPVIAYGKGGALETVIGVRSPVDRARFREHAPATGIFFSEQTVQAVAQAILDYESVQDQFEAEQIRGHARTFDTSIFLERFSAYMRRIFRSSGDPLITNGVIDTPITVVAPATTGPKPEIF